MLTTPRSLKVMSELLAVFTRSGADSRSEDRFEVRSAVSWQLGQSERGMGSGHHY